MSTDGSVNRSNAVPAPMALIAWLVGLVMMGLAIRMASPLGVRPALMVAELFLALPAVVVLAAWRIPLARGLRLDRPTALAAVLALLTSAALWAASLGLFELQYSVWPPPAGYLDQFQMLHRALRPSGLLDATVSVLAIAIAPAACEEILFRGTLLPSFLRRLGPAGAIVLSALLFGIIHLDPTSGGAYTFYRVPFATVVGLGLGVLRLRSGSLTPCILAHAMLNTITFVTVLLTAPGTEPESANVLQAAAFFLLGGAASLFLLRLHARAPDA